MVQYSHVPFINLIMTILTHAYYVSQRSKKQKCILVKILHFITGNPVIQYINISLVTLEVLNFPDRHLIQFQFPLIND